MLGSVDSFPEDVDFSEQYWLEVIIDGQVLSPRYRFSASPYALNIPDDIVFADIRDESGESRLKLTRGNPELKLIGTGQATVHIDETSRNIVVHVPQADDTRSAAEGAVHGRGTSNYVTKWIDEKTIDDSQIYDNGINVGIGTATPGYKLDIAGICHADTFFGDGSKLTGIETNWDTLKAYWDTTNTLGMLLLNESDSSIWMESSHAVGYFSIALGFGAEAKSQYTTVCGGEFNVASGAWSTVGGGQGNTANHQFATIGGGSGNTADSVYTTVCGGFSNEAINTAATVCGGYNNYANAYASVCGGSNNRAEFWYSNVCGGFDNKATHIYSTVCGGYNNQVNGEGSVIPGGRENIVNGGYSLAFGNGVSVDDDHVVAFYNASAPGKLGINNPDPDAELHVNGTVKIQDILQLVPRDTPPFTTGGDEERGTIYYHYDDGHTVINRS